MALNGIDPLLVIVLKVAPPKIVVGPPAPTSLLDDLTQLVGIPIPIYLSKFTGVEVDTESKGIDVVTRVDPLTDKGVDGQTKAPVVSQTSGDSQLTVNLIAKRGSILLTALLVLMDMIVDRLVSKEYSIHYLNGSIAIFGAKLHRFAHSSASGSELINIELVLSTAAKDLPTPKPSIPSVPKETATVPLG